MSSAPDGRAANHPLSATTFRIVEVDADGLDRHTLPASGVVREELPEVQLPDLRVMGVEGLPRRAYMSGAIAIMLISLMIQAH